MRTASLLIAVTAFVATSVHADASDEPATVSPGVINPPDMKAPTKEPLTTKAPVNDLPIVTSAPNGITKGSVGTKAPDTTDIPTSLPLTTQPVVTKAPDMKPPPTTAPVPKDDDDIPSNLTVCHELKNKDRLGFDIGSAKGTFKSCELTCSKTKNCQTWTWNDYEGGTCWLKSHPGELVEKAGVSTTDCSIWTGCNYESNKDWIGFDLGNVRGSLDSCYDKCAQRANCVTFSWTDFNGGTCWLKSYGAKTVEKGGVTAYSCTFDKPTNVCRQYKDIDFVGMDIGNGKSKDAESCCGLCNDFSGCTAYTWTDFNGGTCWFKKSVGHVIAKPGAVASSITPLWGPVCPFE